MAPEQTFEEFLERVETYGFRRKHSAPALLHFLRSALDEADCRGGTLPIGAVARLTGTGVTDGAFAVIVDWLDRHGLLLADDEDALYLHTTGRDLLDGFRAFGVCPERWERLAEQFGCAEVLRDD